MSYVTLSKHYQNRVYQNHDVLSKMMNNNKTSMSYVTVNIAKTNFIDTMMCQAKMMNKIYLNIAKTSFIETMMFQAKVMNKIYLNITKTMSIIKYQYYNLPFKMENNNKMIYVKYITNIYGLYITCSKI